MRNLILKIHQRIKDDEPAWFLGTLFVLVAGTALIINPMETIRTLIGMAAMIFLIAIPFHYGLKFWDSAVKWAKRK